jgi:uncharacterized protein YqhQ
MMSESEAKPRLDVGGQAVIEGVMMRGPRGYVTAVRVPSTGEIIVDEHPYRPLAKRFKPASWPFLRGGIALFEMMVIGLKSLNFAAGTVGEDEERAKGAESGKAGEPDQERGTLTRLALAGTMLISFAFAIVVFVVTPNLSTHILMNFHEVKEFAGEHGWGGALMSLARGESLGFQEHQEPLAYNLVAGAVRISLFLLYVWGISLLKDIHRVYQYHGAEHMAIKTYEAGEPLKVEHARVKTREHPRCGTTFLFITMLIAVFVYSFLTKAMVAIWPWLGELGSRNWWALKGILICSHILCMPIIAGIGYEVVRFAAKRPGNLVIQGLIMPGLLFQRITTKPPDDSMLEVALVSLERALALSEARAEEPVAALDEASGAIY